MPATTETEFREWAQKLRETHPEMFAEERPARRRQTARHKWHPLLLRVYGIRPWELGRFTIAEYAAMVEHLEEMPPGGMNGF